MQWGMPTMVELPDLESNAQLCSRLGLDFVEINMNLPMYQPDKLDEAAALSEKYGIGFTVHLDENFAPADFNPLIAEAWIETLCRTLRAARRLEMPVVNMHMSKGVYFSMPNGKIFLFERFRKEYIESMYRVRRICDEELSGSGTCICIENTNGYADFQKEAMEILLQSDVFGLTWDTGHWQKTKIDDGPFMQSHGGKIRHFHIHDADDSGDHLPLGKGNIDIQKMISYAQSCNARCVVETKTATALEESVEWLKKRNWM